VTEAVPEEPIAPDELTVPEEPIAPDESAATDPAASDSRSISLALVDANPPHPTTTQEPSVDAICPILLSIKGRIHCKSRAQRKHSKSVNLAGHSVPLAAIAIIREAIVGGWNHRPS